VDNNLSLVVSPGEATQNRPGVTECHWGQAAQMTDGPAAVIRPARPAP